MHSAAAVTVVRCTVQVRVRELRDVVDRFVLLEAAKTFQVGVYVLAFGA